MDLLTDGRNFNSNNSPSLSDATNKWVNLKRENSQFLNLVNQVIS